jgi:hypothetical protein
VAPAWDKRLRNLCEKTKEAPPADLAQVVRDELAVDLTARYGNTLISHPFGKASGQLSHKLHQVESDISAGVAFVVLKTVIAEDDSAGRSMREWVTRDTHMKVERKVSRQGREGWTVTWKGRGWAGSLDEYLAFYAAAMLAARPSGIPVIPSVKYHLPVGGEQIRNAEYRHTTGKLLDCWQQAGGEGSMPLEKDLSPTLAGDRRSGERNNVIAWLGTVPGLIDRTAPGRVHLGVKLMNALFDDEFQVDMIEALAQRADPAPAFLVVFNRLFDPELGLAYGGWDLSDRNLRVLDLARTRLGSLPRLSATGNICSGRVMVEYALRGCENGQVHTFFQIPHSEYTATGGSRSARALHTLLLHPTDGLVVWLRHIHEMGKLDQRGGLVRFLDLVASARGAL